MSDPTSPATPPAYQPGGYAPRPAVPSGGQPTGPERATGPVSWSGRPGQPGGPGSPGQPVGSPFATGRYVPRTETRWLWCVAGLILSIAVVVASVRLFVLTPAWRMVDQAAFLGSTLGREQVEPYAKVVLGVVSPLFLVGATIVAVVLALARKAFGDAVRAVVVVVGANLTTQLLKGVIERPIDDLPQATYGNSLPSGHTTVAASVVAILLIVVGRSWRPLVALLGVLYAGATGIATLALAWHRPSDAVAAFAVVAAWSLLVLIPNRGRAVPDVVVNPLRILVSWLLGVAAVAGLTVGFVALSVAFARAGGDLSSGSALLEPVTRRAAYVGACAGTGGAAAFFVWWQLLARR
ncbi:MAG: hypothetical protein BGO96_07700 [Micrococcales bacterium 73-15]|uniref:phosphatase PAP2 family protein n=1 Tax=Salana multivorans TaxID=120377 RepID=UPI000961F481|nr:phosphatase PAP2 family protein [Salana multivorans]OJX96145.1 MAG: hypothetical protein BGO96_07700 [Micrococcales bacterium 73-15]